MKLESLPYILEMRMVIEQRARAESTSIYNYVFLIVIQLACALTIFEFGGYFFFCSLRLGSSGKKQ